MPTLDDLTDTRLRDDTLFCTVVTRSHLRYAWVLRESVRRHHPDAAFCVLVADALDGDPLPEAAHFDCPLVRLDAFMTPAIDDMTVYYTAYEFCGNIKPFFLAYLFRTTPARKLVYLDSDLYVTGPLRAVVAALDSHDATCAPHTLSPLPDDGSEPSDLTVAANGTLNTGMMGFARCPAVLDLLDWLGQRVHRHGFNAFSRGMFCEQRFFNLGVTFLKDRFRPVVERGCNVGYWNLHERTLEPRGDGLWFVNGERVAYFHLSGFEPEMQDRLSKHEQRYTLATHPQAPAVRQLLDEYRTLFAPLPFTPAEDYRFDRRDGIRLTPALRRAYHERGSLGTVVTLQEALALARRHAETGDHRAARNFYSQILSRNGAHVEALYGLAVALQALGEETQARRVLHQLLAVAPDHADAARRLGLAGVSP